MTRVGRVTPVLLLIFGLLSGSRARAAEPFSSDSGHVEEARAKLLADHLDRYSGLAAVEPYLPAVTGSVCAVASVGLAVADTNELNVSRGVLVTPAVACSVVSFASYAAPRDYRLTMGLGSFLAASAAEWSIMMLSTRQGTTAERVSAGGLAASGVAMSTLYLLDALLARPVSPSTLAEAAVTLRAGGSILSRAEVARFEGYYERATVRPIPRSAYGLSLLVGGAISLSPVLFPTTSKRDSSVVLGFAAFQLLLGASSLTGALLTPNGYDRYTRELSRIRLSPLGPSAAAGLWIFAPL